MLATLKLHFTKNTDARFIDPRTMKTMWYQCYYGRGTTMEIADIVSGNTQHIFAFCLDGEIVKVDTDAVKIEHL